MNEINLLLVDDSEDDRLLAVRAISKLPIPVKVEIARDGSEALGLLLGTPELPAPATPSVVLLDLRMPKLSGREVLARLRDEPATREIPVIVLTASDHPADVKECMRMGAIGFLVKPIEAGSLSELLGVAGHWKAEAT